MSTTSPTAAPQSPAGTGRDDEQTVGLGRRLGGQQLLVKFNLLIVFLVVCVVASLVAPEFLSTRNISNLLQQSSLVGIVAIGMTVVVLTAGIDLSVGSTAALAGMVVALLIGTGWAWPLAVAATLLMGLALGALMGGLSAFLSLPSFMVTLAGLTSIRGITYLTTNGTPTTGTIPSGLSWLGAGRLAGVPVVGIVFILVTVLAGLLLRGTAVGEYVYASGSNPVAARLSGLPVAWVQTGAFALCGMLAALSGILLTARLTIGQPTASQGLELSAIAAVVLGGTSLFGGKGGVLGTFIAVLLLSVLSNVFNLMGLSSYFQQLVTGLILVTALILNRILERRGAGA
ncbi:MAG: ABC-type sugar transporter, permease protein [Marmoricola sp.]|nr:ABC-type sugar transporter, permease protein [Marmoricola sp.]